MSDWSSTVQVDRNGSTAHRTALEALSLVCGRIAVLACADMVAFMAAAVLFRHGRSVPEVTVMLDAGSVNQPIDIFRILCPAFLAVRYVLGDYSRRRLFWDATQSTTLALLVFAAPCFALLFAFPDRYSAVAEIGTWSFLLFTIPLLRQAARIGMSKLGMWTLPTVLVASNSRLANMHDAIQNNVSLGYDVRWVIIEDPEGEMPASVTGPARLYMTKPSETAFALADSGCMQAIIATDEVQSTTYAELVQRLVQVGVDVSFSPSFRRLPLSGITTSLFFGRDVLLLQTRSSLRRLPHRIVKRLFDIVFSLIGITLLAPLFIATTALIKLRHWSVPVLFGQKVIGRDGRPFPMWKFSTMVNNAHLLLEQVLKTNPALRQEWNETFKLRDDPRVLPGIGDFLRKTSLNELPQLFNVLMGDMSLVGPRPVKSAELVQFYGPAAQLYKTVRPGITGLWQVSGRSDTSYEERVNYDVWYILNWSLWYDIVILLRTVWAVLRRKGAY